jgi:hypothetical protein
MYLTDEYGPWFPLPGDEGEHVLTRVLDLLELYELKMLQSQPRHGAQQRRQRVK